MLAEQNYQFGHFQSAVIACIFVNSVMGFLTATGNQDFSFTPHATRQGTQHHRTDPRAELPGLKEKKYYTGSLSIFQTPAAWKCALAVSHPRADMAQCCFLIVKSNRVSMRRAERRQSDRRGQLSLFVGGLQPLRLVSVWKGKDEICEQSCGIREAEGPSSFSADLFQEDCHSFLIFKLKAARHECTRMCGKEWVLYYSDLQSCFDAGFSFLKGVHVCMLIIATLLQKKMVFLAF